MLINLSSLLNTKLFELDRSQELGIEQRLIAYLDSSQYPWELLGKGLTEFLSSWVQSVPLSQRHRGNIHPQAYLENPESIVVLEGAVIEPFAFVAGPTIVAANATVRHGAYVRGSVYIGPDAVVGHTSEVKGSLLLNKAKAAHFAYVGDSILGVDTNLGAGTKFANLRFDHTNVKISVPQNPIDSGLKKLGAILGNRAQTGCNSVTNPGTILLPDAIILPTANARGIVRGRG